MEDECLKQVRVAVESVVREEWSQTLSALVYRIRDFQLAEDALQDAIVAALKHWPQRGIPAQPRAWLYRTARHKAIDHIRRRENFAAKQEQVRLVSELEGESDRERLDTEIRDERLRMIFTCCHPALSLRSSVALTLWAIAGLETRQIARAFLSEEASMSQRLTRAKRKIRDAGIPYRVPSSDLWPERLEAVLAVIYFIFNEGYLASSGERLIRTDLCQEAIRLVRVLVELTPGECEAQGLLALMLLHDSRRLSRSGRDGKFIPLEEQDRCLWDRGAIEEGDAILREALSRRSIGSYQIQAAVSAVHAHASDWRSTDWPQIAQLYRTLYHLKPSTVIRLNEAVAISMVQGPARGLEILDEISDAGLLQSYQPFFAAKADFLRKLGKVEEARQAYKRAVELSQNRGEIEFLEEKLRTLARRSD